MLNSLPHSATPSINRPILPRRRGGQPSNTNALKHGHYAAKKPFPFPGVSALAWAGLTSPSNNAVLAASSKYLQQILEELQDGLWKAIPDLQQKVLSVLNNTQNPRDFPSTLSSLRLATRQVGDMQRVQLTLYKLQQPGLDLQFVAQHAHALVRYDFRSQGITRDADSFRENLNSSDFNSLPSSAPQRLSHAISGTGHSFRDNRVLSDFNSPSFREHDGASRVDSPHPFLTSRQWAVLEPLLPPMDHKPSRGRPPADPRKLLDAIFWKFANHARWKDLPGYYPPMLTCRRYYRRLFLSGRLATLYSALYKDFRLNGNTELSTYVNQGCIDISSLKLTFRPGLNETWQLRTALLFLQQGYQVLRCHFGKKGRNGFRI